jgi:hypothetical protein
MSLHAEPGRPAAAQPKRWRAPAVAQVAGFMSLLDVSIVNVALPSGWSRGWRPNCADHSGRATGRYPPSLRR